MNGATTSTDFQETFCRRIRWRNRDPQEGEDERMTSDLAEQFWRHLTDAQKIEACARLAHMLTVAARETYEAGTLNVTLPGRLREINEIQHHVTGALVQMIETGDFKFADDSLVMLFHAGTCDDGLQTILEFVFERVAMAVSPGDLP